MRAYTFHVPSSLALRAIARTDVRAIAVARTLACACLITRDTDGDDYSRSLGDTSRYRVTSRFDAASRTLTFHRDKTGFEIAYLVGVDSAVQCVQ